MEKKIEIEKVCEIAQKYGTEIAMELYNNSPDIESPGGDGSAIAAMIREETKKMVNAKKKENEQSRRF